MVLKNVFIYKILNFLVNKENIHEDNLEKKLEEKLKKINSTEFQNLKQSKNDFIEIRNEVKENMNFITFIHTVLFSVIIIMQLKIYYRFHINSSLSSYFNINTDENLLTGIYYQTPNKLFSRLINLLKTNSFVFIDKKYEIITNIRVTQRLIIIKEDFTQNIDFNQIKTKIKNYNLKKINPFSSYNPEYESKEDLNNKYKYNTEDCNF